MSTNDDSLIILPNGKLSDSFVNNLGSQRYDLGSLKLPLPYSTSVAQLEALMRGAREIVDAVPEVAPQRTSLGLTTAGVDGMQLTLIYSIDVSRGGDETGIVNRLVLDVLSYASGWASRRRAAAPHGRLNPSRRPRGRQMVIGQRF